MLVKIDMRETDLIPLLKDVTVVVEVLPIGDVIICDDTGVEKLIIERKTVRDLLSSIKDGRYDEQSHRLGGNELPNHNIVYMIEGSISQPNRQLAFSSMFSLNYYKGFSIIRTMSLDESAFFICNTVSKMTRETEQNRQPYSVNAVCEEYANVVKKVKKDNINPQNIHEIMLSQIPGISNVTANTIMTKFSTIHNLIESLKSDDNCLNDLTYITKKGQTRKINKGCATIIRNFLL
jgi:ERCC4-type nuclease